MRLTLLVLLALTTFAAHAQPASTPANWPTPWLGVHVGVYGDFAMDQLTAEVPALAKLGVNALVIEINYNFDYRSHPEVHGANPITRGAASRLVEACRAHKIRIIPQINCLGHQSWKANTAALLAKHPEFDETPGQYPGNKGIYCRSWCPLNPEVNPFVFDLMDELIDAFHADAFHVGMDEVFLIGSEFCPRCKGKNPAELFARAVNDYHAHLVGRRKVEMFMWADRLLDGKKTGYGSWEGATNGTAPAIDMIPKDIVLCDWHYTKRAAYPSVPLFLEKGFRVWPSGWDKVDATLALANFARQQNSPRMVGHLATVWGKAQVNQLAEFAPLKAVSALYHPE